MTGPRLSTLQWLEVLFKRFFWLRNLFLKRLLWLTTDLLAILKASRRLPESDSEESLSTSRSLPKISRSFTRTVESNLVVRLACSIRSSEPEAGPAVLKARHPRLCSLENSGCGGVSRKLVFQIFELQNFNHSTSNACQSVFWRQRFDSNSPEVTSVFALPLK